MCWVVVERVVHGIVIRLLRLRAWPVEVLVIVGDQPGNSVAAVRGDKYY